MTKQTPAFISKCSIRIDGKESKRLMVVFRTTGCGYAKKTGGCRMCGFQINADKDITSEDILEQLKLALNSVDMSDVGRIDLLALGSFFDDEEINPSLRCNLVKEVCKYKSIRRIFVESRNEYITVEKLLQITSLIGSIKLEVGIGFETLNDEIRNKILKKGISRVQLEQFIIKLKEASVEPCTHILIKPPFLTDKEAITEAVESAKYVLALGEKHGVKVHVAFEPVFVCNDTWLEEKFLNNEYKILNLWSVLSVLKQTHGLGDIFVGLNDEDLAYDRVPSSGCSNCNSMLLSAIENYNRTQDIKFIEECSCEFCHNE